MLAGIVVIAIVAGLPFLALSIAIGHPPLISLMAYSLSGSCGVLLFALAAAHLETLRLRRDARG